MSLADSRSSESPSSIPPGPHGPASPVPGEIPYVPRNFWAWVAYQFFYRVGWQFKMEATLMAGLVSYLAPSPLVMGLFTTLNNIGRNLTPLLSAPLVDRFPRKRSALLVFWLLTVGIWATLTVYLWTPAAEHRERAIWVFGACYTLFFVSLGASSVAQGTLLGKVIPAGMRGRSLAVGMSLSGVINVAGILLVFRLVESGRFPEPKNYALSFTLTAVLFLFAAASLLFMQEHDSEVPKRANSVGASLRHAARLTRSNPNLARLMVVNTAVGILGSLLQFYTGFWRKSGTMSPGALVMATVFQVFWQSLSSSILGRVADRRGNRVIICALLWAEVSIPLIALVFGGMAPFRGHWGWYLTVYTMVGIRFPLYQLLVNYLLEIVEPQDHAMALGAVSSIQLLTAPAPLLLGKLAEVFGYAPVFLLGSVIGAVGSIVALRLEEVRLKA
jgi:MFS family permease